MRNASRTAAVVLLVIAAVSARAFEVGLCSYEKGANSYEGLVSIGELEGWCYDGDATPPRVYVRGTGLFTITVYIEQEWQPHFITKVWIGDECHVYDDDKDDGTYTFLIADLPVDVSWEVWEKKYAFGIVTSDKLMDEDSVTVHQHNLGPSLSLDVQPDTWSQESVTITPSASDAVCGINPFSWEAKVNEGEWQALDRDDLRRTVSEPGRYEVAFRVENTLGAATTRSLNVGIDRTPPSGSLGTLPPEWRNQPLEVRLDEWGDEESGMALGYPRVSVSGAGASQEREGEATVVTAEGESRVCFVLRDRVGHETRLHGRVRLDRTPPEVFAPDVAWTNQEVLVRPQASDQTGLSGVDETTWTWRLNDGPVRTCSDRPALSVHLPGTNRVTWSVRDRAGNTGSAVSLVRIDTEPPAITVATPAWSRGPVRVEATATDPPHGSGVNEASWQYRVNGGPLSPASPEARTSREIAADGRHTVDFRVTDVAGNVATAAAAVLIDSTPPDLDPPAALSVTLAHARFVPTGTIAAALAADALSGLAVGSGVWRIGNDAWRDGLVAIIPKGQNGPVQVSYRVRDVAGNETLVVGYAVADSKPPVLSLPARTTASLSVSAVATDSGGSGVDPGAWQWRVLSGPGVHQPRPWREGSEAVLPGDGTFSLAFRVADRVGNESAATFSVTADTTPPVVRVRSLTDGVALAAWTSAGTVQLSATAADAAAPVTMFWRRGGDPSWRPWDGAPVVAQSSGVHEFEWRAVDAVGNSTVVPAAVWIDRQGPRLSPSVRTVGVEPGRWTRIAPVELTCAADDGEGSGVADTAWQHRVNDGAWRRGRHAVVRTPGESVVEFRAHDRVGNAGAAAAVRVLVDTAGPAVSARPAPWAERAHGAEQIVVHDLVATDLHTGVAASSWQYAFDDAPWQGLPRRAGTTVGLATDDLAEGRHRLRVRVSDGVGNYGDAAFSFVVDRSAPAPPEVFIRDSSGAVFDGGFAREESVSAVFAGEDGGAVPTGVVGFNYRLSEGAPAVDGPTAALSPGQAPDLSRVGTGVWYLTARAVDAAGNAGAWRTVSFVIDGAPPGPPVISSTTHPTARTAADAVSRHEAVFRLEPSTTGRSGAASIRYRVLRGNEQVAAGRVDPDAPTLELAGLPDNRQNEFYRVLARVEGGTGVCGPEASYRFRVDTVPPVGLAPRTAPVANADGWIAGTRVGVTWQPPSDMSGIRRYYYGISTTEPPEAKDALPIGGLADMHTTQAESVSLDLAAATGRRTGSAWITICAEDVVGNHDACTVRVNFDGEAPTLPVPAGRLSALRVAVDGQRRRAAVSWLPPRDEGGAGPPRRGVLRVYRVEDEVLVAWGRRVFLDPAVSGYALEGLASPAQYVVQLVVRDAAGNTVTASDGFGVGMEPPLADVAVPFETRVAGLLVTGLHSATEGVTQAFLGVPNTLGLRELFAAPNEQGAGENSAAGVSVSRGCQILLDSCEPTGDGYLVRTRPMRRFAISPAGYRGEASGLRLDDADGLAWETFAVRLPDGDGPPDTALVFRDAGMGFPPDFPLSRGDGNAPPRFAPVPGASGVTTMIEGAHRASLGHGGVVLFGGTLRLDEFARRAGVELRPSVAAGDPDPGLPLVRSRIRADGSIRECVFDPARPFVLATRDAAFLVHDASFDGRALLIDRATLLVEGLPSSEFPGIRLFSVQADGAVEPRAGFALEPFVLAWPGGATARVDGAHFRRDGSLAVAGRLSAGSGPVWTFSDGRLPTAVGDAFEATAPELRVTFHGFRFAAASVRVTPDGVALARATLVSAPAPFDDLVGAPFSGLVAAHDLSQIVRPGTCDRPVEVDTPYSAAIPCEGLRLQPDGLYAVAPSIPLPGSHLRFRLRHMELEPDGTVETTGEDGPQTVHLFGFELAVDDAEFDGRRLRVRDGRLRLPFVGADSWAILPRCELTAHGVVACEPAPVRRAVRRNGWTLQVASARLAQGGVAASLVAVVPGGGRVLFPDALWRSDGSLVTGASEGVARLRVGGFSISLDRCELSAGGLEVSRARLHLPRSLGADPVPLRRLAFRPDGRLREAVSAPAIRAFRSTNGFRTEIRNVTVGNDGVGIQGLVELPPGLGEGRAVDVAAGDAELTPDGAVVTRKLSPAAALRLAGFSAHVQACRFHRGGVELNGIELRIHRLAGSLSFGSVNVRRDGSLVPAGGLPPVEPMAIFGGTLQVGRPRLSDSGIAVAVDLALPSFLGGYQMRFDPVVLHPDGGLSADVAVRELTVPLGSGSATLRRLAFADDGIHIGEAILSLPVGADHRRFKAQELRIGRAGLSVGEAGFHPVELWGLTFLLDSFQIDRNEVGFSGRIRLPDRFPEGLARRWVEIRELAVGLDGNGVRFDCRLAEPVHIVVAPGWTVVAKGLALTYDPQAGAVCSLEEAEISLPASMGAEGLRISGLRVETRTGRLSFDSAQVEGIELDLMGVTVRVDSLGVDAQRRLVLAGRATLPSSLPGALAGASLEVVELVLAPDGTIVALDVQSDSLSGPLIGDVHLTEGHVRLRTAEARLLAVCTGALRLGWSFPEGLAGTAVRMRRYVYDLTRGVLVALEAEAEIPDLPLWGITTVRDAGLRVVADGTEARLIVAGRLVLPAALPGPFGGAEAVLESVEVDVHGGVQSVDAFLVREGTHSLFGGILVSDPAVRATLQGGLICYRLSGDFRFGPSFPEGLRGVGLSVRDLSFDALGRLLRVDAQAVLRVPDFLGAGNLTGGLRAVLADDGSLELVASGTLRFGAGAPRPLAGLTLILQELAVGADGRLLRLDAGAHGISAPLFGGAVVEDGAAALHVDSAGDVMATFSGVLVLPRSLPDGLAGARLRLRRLEVSPRSGLIACEAGLDSPVTVSVYAGVAVTCSTLAVGEDGLVAAGTVVLPPGFPDGLAGTLLAVDRLELGWDGSVRDLSARIGRVGFSAGGFLVECSGVSADEAGIALKGAFITLPSAVGGGSIGMREARIGWDGELRGDLAAEELTVAVAGCELRFEEPSLHATERRLRFQRVVFRLPDALGGRETEVAGVSIGPSGLSVDGGRIGIPDFSLAGGLEFMGFEAAFETAAGGYRIEGHGTVFVKGLGELGGSIGFAPASDDYPFGLTHALFEFRIPGLGLPLGATGLYVNGLRGGLAFGPVGRETPEELRVIAAGTRIQVGVGLRDASGSFSGVPTAWVNVENWDWGFYGDFSLLYGLVDARVTATLTQRYGFEGRFRVAIAFVRGEARIHVWRDGDAVARFCGSVQAEIRIPAGAFLVFPEEDLWLGPVAAELGDFSDDERGVKAYLALPVLGEVGVFVGTEGTIRFGSVSEYVLLDEVSAGAAGLSAQSAAPRLSAATRQVEYLDQGADGRRLYRFNVADATDPSATTRRIVGLLRSDERGAALVFHSPSGRTLTGADRSVEALRTVSGYAAAVREPQPGTWKVEVIGVDAAADWDLRILGVSEGPSLTLDDLSPGGEDRRVTVTGWAEFAGPEATVALYRTVDGESFTGEGLVSRRLASPGRFTLSVGHELLPAGEHHLFVRLTDGVNPSRDRFLNTAVTVEHGDAPPSPPSNVALSPARDGAVVISFRHPAPGRVTGYRLYVADLRTGALRNLDLGGLTEVAVPGVGPDDRAEIWVAAYDAVGRESDPSPVATLPFPAAQVVAQSLTVEPERLAVRLLPGESASVTLALQGEAASSASPAAAEPGVLRSAAVELAAAPAFLRATAGGSLFDSATSSFFVPVTVVADSAATAGVHEGILRVRLPAARALQLEVPVTVEILSPPPVIRGVEPRRVISGRTERVTVTGAGFAPRATAHFGPQEATVLDASAERLVVVPPAGAPPGGALTITNPDGAAATTELDVVVPGYRVLARVSRAALSSGDSGAFVVQTVSTYGFDGSCTFTVLNAPAALEPSWHTRRFDVGTPVVLPLTVAEDAVAGTYEILLGSDRGHRVVLTAVVDPDAQALHLSCISPSVARPGERITLYGLGLESATGTFLDGRPLEIVQRRSTALTVLLPEDCESGDITVASRQETTGPLPLTVHTRSLSVSLHRPLETLRPGARTDGTILVSGGDGPVGLSVMDPPPGLVVHLSTRRCTPGSAVSFTVTALPEAQNGEHTCRIRAASPRVSRILSVPVRVAGAFELSADTAPPAIVHSRYRHRILATAPVGAPAYALQAGHLPPGLALAPDGTIAGTPTAVGTWRFQVSARDQAGRNAAAALSLRVEDQPWQSRSGGADGASFAATDGPAVLTETWSTRVGAPVNGLVAGGGRIYAVTERGVAILHADSGAREGLVQIAGDDAAYHPEALLVHDTAAGLLTAAEPGSGEVIYRVSGVRSFVVVDRRIFVERGETVEVRDVGTGGITASVPRSGGDTDVRSLWAAAENGAWRSSGTVLMRHDDTAVPAGVVRSSAPIVAVAAIADAGLVALTEEGTVAFIGPEGTQHTTFTSGTAGSRIAANADGCYLYGPTGLTAFSLPSGGKTFRLQRPIHALAVTPNKLYLAVNGRLLCRNAHTGEAISAVAGSFDGLALYRGRVYAVDSAGIVRCYTGEADAVAPTTEFRITGRAGQGGYFTEPATVTVAASDRDSQVRRTLLKHADGAWAPAPGRLELGDGRHVLYAYSEDTAGRREALRTRTVWVDGTPPGTTVTVHGRQGKNGWFVSQPTVRLHSTDATSGVAETSYRLNGGPWHRYTGPFRLSVAGRVTVEARAADRAGNLGAAADRDISVDTTPPELEVLISPAGAGPAAAAAVARDEESGVASVEYRVDGGPWRPYRGPVAVHGVGPGEVNVRAENGAGLRLQRRVILPGGTPLAKRHAATADDAPPAAAPGQPRARLRPADLRFTYWLPGRALLRVTGDRVPLDHRPTGPQAAPVPAWLRGSTYLLTHPLDRLYAGRCLAAWVSRRFLVVYALVPPSAGPDMTGWTLIERSPVVRFDKPGQAAPGDGERVRCSVFMRRFEPGETVRLPGAASSRSGSQVLYFFARQAMHPAAR